MQAIPIPLGSAENKTGGESNDLDRIESLFLSDDQAFSLIQRKPDESL